MTKILDEQLEFKKQNYTGLELKHHKKGFYRKFPLYNLHKSKKCDEKITAYFISSPTFMSTSNILMNTPLKPGTSNRGRG